MPKNSLRWFSLLLPGFAAMVIGCGGYTSHYVPPADGRPRLVWQDNRVVPMMANAMPPACSSETDALLGGSGSVPVRGPSSGGGGGYSGGGGYWVPVRTVGVVRVSGVPRPFVPSFSGGGSGGFSGIGKIGGGGGGGGGGDIGKAAILVAVLAIAVLPFIAVGLAAGRPEPEGQVAAAIDQVNAQTDLARVPGSACDELVVAAEVAQ